MRKLLLLICALLTGVSGAWAATTPAEGTYPVEGKTYYFFANKYNSTDRYYLYWDNTNSALKRAAANSKENNDFYKWTVTVSDGKYYITNVGTGTKLAWDNSNGLTLKQSGSLFDLSQSVDYTACVSLYYSNFWCCVENGAETFRSGLKFSNSFSAGNTTYSLNFVFEEVLSAHSLTDGSYYTIYCDNDNKQYLYDNAGTLAQTSSAPASDLKYVWQCIVSGDYYNFRNLQTGKYLGWRAMSASAYNYTITTTQAIHDGCATMWGVNAKRNWSINTDGTLTTGQTTTKDDKVTSDWCTDFRFDAVDLSSWCTGDLLGGSISGTDNWTNTWTSGTSPSFTLTASANNINHKNDRTTGGLDIRSGQSTTSTYTITAPTGYLVTGYKIVGYALNGDQTVTPSKGGDATIFKTTGNSISVSGLRQGKASFTLSGANDGLFIRALQVSLAPIASITTLPTANNKAYAIFNARAAWNFADDATSMNAVALDLDEEGQQIALIYHNENYYLYSVNAGKYLTAENTLTSVVTDNEQISITATGNATYPWFFSFKNVADKNINIDGNPTVRINSHSTLDAGNQNAIVEVGDFDATEALAIFDNRYVTYNLSYGGNSTFRTENNVVVAIGGDPADYVPESWKAAYCTLTYDVNSIEESTTTVNVTATWNGPFDISSDFNSAKWYYLKVNGKWAVYGNFTYNSNLITQPYDNETNAQNAIAKSMWAFVGNPYDGFEIMNRHAGSGMYLNSQSGVAMFMSSSNEFTTFKIAQKEGNTFSMNNGGFYINCGASYIAANKGVSENATSSLMVEDIPYKFLALAYLPEYAASHHMGEYFGVDESSYNEIVTMATSLESMNENEYNVLVSNINNYLSPKLPETGYYRIKSSGSRGDQSYITYGYLDGSKGTGLLTTIGNKETDLGTVVKLTRVGTSKNYKISIQGLNVQAHSGDNTLFRATGDEGQSFQFNHINFSGMCSIYDGTDHGNMHEAGWKKPDTGLNGVVGWGAGDGTNASSWCLEDASTIEVTLNKVEPASYATLYVDFPVAIPEGNKSTAIYTLSESNGVYTCYKQTSVPPRTGIIIRDISAASSVTLSIPSTYNEDDEVTSALTGSFLDTTASSDCYIFSTGEEGLGFYFYASGSPLAANKAYLVPKNNDSGIRGFALSFNDTETGISETETFAKDSKLFDLQGRHIAKPQHGIYIVNGKKVLF